MIGNAAGVAWAELDPYLERYERAFVSSGSAQISDYLPDPSSRLYPVVLKELIRADIEFHWGSGKPRELEDYLMEFPSLRDDAKSLSDIAFEEYRVRLRMGHAISPDQYRDRLGIDLSDWPELLPSNASGSSRNQAEGGRLSSQIMDEAEWASSIYLARSPRETTQPSDQHDEEIYAGEAISTHYTLLRELHKESPQEARAFARATIELTYGGHRFPGFRMVDELGRGAFGRAYLARQLDLSNRAVVLKVSANLIDESRLLSHLQHSYICPIYSTHRSGPLQAICMPFVGGTTFDTVVTHLRKRNELPTSGRWLADLLREQFRLKQTKDECEIALKAFDNITYIEAILQIISQVVEGLVHAHERGIVHRDLKPANLLLGDDGRPLILDFSLSANTRVKSLATAALVGGTLPYMAPEALKGFRDRKESIDARSDIYAIGLILYKLLSGRHPYPITSGQVDTVISDAIRNRLQAPPDIIRLNPWVTPDLASIINKCLQPELANRYESARHLLEDLERHRTHLPLKYAPNRSIRERMQKWARRHPRLTSTSAVSSLAGVIVLGMGLAYAYRGQQLEKFRSEERYQAFEDDYKRSRFLLNSPSIDQLELQEGVKLAELALNRFRVLDASSTTDLPTVGLVASERQAELASQFSELLLFLAGAKGVEARQSPNTTNRLKHLEDAFRLNRLASEWNNSEASKPPIDLQRLSLEQLDKGRDPKSIEPISIAKPAGSSSPRVLYLEAYSLMLSGEYRKAVGLLRQACRLDPQDAFSHYALGSCQLALGDAREAQANLDTSIALWPRFYRSFYLRAGAFMEMKQYARAIEDFDESISLRPSFVPSYVDRALAKAALKDFSGAIADLDHAIKSGSSPTRIHFMRSRVRQQSGDLAGARLDLTTGMQLEPKDERDWIARGLARLGNDPHAALADFEEALKLNPTSIEAFQDKAHVLSERLNRPQEALLALNTSIELRPDYAIARAGRGVLLARLGKRSDAIADAQAALLLDDSPSIRYQVAGIYAQTSRTQPSDRDDAIRLLAQALKADFGFQIIDADPDLAPIRSDSNYIRMLEAARALQASSVKK
jgi:serine/threonine protein kinase/predicted Zn-dependent protease